MDKRSTESTKSKLSGVMIVCFEAKQAPAMPAMKELRPNAVSLTRKTGTPIQDAANSSSRIATNARPSRPVVATGAAGVGFCLVRIWSDSLLPSIALHASLNALGFALSWAFARRLRDL